MNFGQGGNEMPFNLALGVVLEKSNAVGDLVTTDNIKPSPRQYALGPGDWAVTAGSNSELDQNLMLLELLDPAEYADEFPDWEDRVMKSYVLCRWRDKAREDPKVTEGLGWFSRVKLIWLTDEQLEIVKEWHETDFPEDMPDWLIELYHEYSAELAGVSPGQVPKFTKCGLCGGRKVIMQVVHSISVTAPAGELHEEEKVTYVPMGTYDHQTETSARLHCLDCHGNKDLDDGEFLLNKATSAAVISLPHGH